MIINFSELQLSFHRLGPGAVLISPEDTHYLKSVGEDLLDYWVHAKDLWSNQATSDAPDEEENRRRRRMESSAMKTYTETL